MARSVETRSVETVVLGAGIAGLAYAHARGEAELLVLEAGARAGGLISTHRGAGWHVEQGPEALQDNEPDVLALFAELGLTPRAAEPSARRRFLVDDRRRLVPTPSSAREALGWSLLSPAARMTALAGMFRRRASDLSGSLAHFVRARFGEQVLARVVDPAVSGIWAGDPALLSLEAALPRLHDKLKVHGSLVGLLRAAAAERKAAGRPRRPGPSLISLAGGLDGLPSALAHSLGERLLLHWPAKRVRRVGAHWSVEGPAGVVEARRCVLALPAAAAAAVLAEDEPALALELRALRSESVVSVAHVWRRSDLAHALDGFGCLVPSSLGLSHLGTLFSSSIQPDRARPGEVVLRTLLGGARRPDLVAQDDEALRRIVVQEVGALLGAAAGARPLEWQITRWPSVLPRYDLDHPGRQARIDGALAQRPGLHLVGNHRRGLAVNALIQTSRVLAREHA